MAKRIKKGDAVVVIAGNDKGERGVVLEVDYKKERVKVEGVNSRRQSIRPSQANPQGGLVEHEMPIHLSNVMLEEAYNAKAAK